MENPGLTVVPSTLTWLRIAITSLLPSSSTSQSRSRSQGIMAVEMSYHWHRAIILQNMPLEITFVIWREWKEISWTFCQTSSMEDWSPKQEQGLWNLCPYGTLSKDIMELLIEQPIWTQKICVKLRMTYKFLLISSMEMQVILSQALWPYLGLFSVFAFDWNPTFLWKQRFRAFTLLTENIAPLSLGASSGQRLLIFDEIYDWVLIWHYLMSNVEDTSEAHGFLRRLSRRVT